jgi:predicted dienelactone hydrolase
MQLIDLGALLALLLALGALVLRRRSLVWAILALGLSVAAVVMLHWQAVPTVVVSLVALLLVGIRARWRRGGYLRPARWRRVVAWIAVVVTVVVVAAPYYLFPLFSLPEPDGAYAIGTTRIELVDPARHGVLEDAPTQARRMTVQLWYPAEPGSKQPLARYLPVEHIRSEGASLAENLGYQPYQLLHLAAIPTHSRLQAEPSRDGHFPLVLFNHGYRMYPAQNTPLFERLASHGYVVASISHPYDSARIDFADGSSAPTAPFQVSPALLEVMGKLVPKLDVENWTALFPAYARAVREDRLSRSEQAWEADTAFVLATLEKGGGSPLVGRLTGRIDFARLAYGGMSFGGGVAVKSCEAEPRCHAAFSLDGVVYDPAMYDRDVRAPLLLLHSDWVEHPLFLGQPRTADVHPMDFAYRRWRSDDAATDDFRMRVRTSAHLAMTDLVHLTRWPGREMFYGTIAPREMEGVLDDFSLAFLDTYVRGRDTGFPVAQLARWPLVERHDPRGVGLR